MDAKKTFKKLEQIYARRRKIETARQAVLDQQLNQRAQRITALEQHRTASDKAHENDVYALLRSANKAIHYNTLLSALASKKIKHHGSMAILRHETLRQREAQDKTREEAADQKDVTRNAARRAEKMKILLDAEVIAEDALSEIQDEEEAAEAQASGQVSHA
jgi:hypothetical protein